MKAVVKTYLACFVRTSQKNFPENNPFPDRCTHCLKIWSHLVGMNTVILIVAAVVLCLSGHAVARPTEAERVDAWYAKNHTWPPNWNPKASAQFKYAMSVRERELQLIPGSNERWENYVQYTQSLLVPWFTEVGFKVIQIPPEIYAVLKERVDKGIEDWENLRLERQIDAVYTPLPSKFIDMPDVNAAVISALKGLHEEWVGGIELQATSAYGTRLYQNGSSLVMHHDKTTTHVVSSIVHIAHKYDDDNHPWPIEIEDHQGNLHAVNLEPGQMLFYESAACVHGRRQKFRGKYYGSVFLHYQPVDRNIWDYSIEDVIAHVPPHWRDGVVEETGSRWSGQGLTVDSMIPEGAHPRVIKGKAVPDIEQYYAKHNPAHLRAANARVLPKPVEEEGRDEL